MGSTSGLLALPVRSRLLASLSRHAAFAARTAQEVHPCMLHAHTTLCVPAGAVQCTGYG